MSKSFFIIVTWLLFATGCVWLSIALSLVAAFRFAAYALPFAVLTGTLWIYNVHEYIFASYGVLAGILIVFVYTRSYFRFST